MSRLRLQRVQLSDLPECRYGARTRLSVLLLAALVACADEAPRGEPAQRIERPAFSGARAFELVETQLAFGPRIPGAEGHAAQLEWMVELLAGLADTVLVDRFSHVTSTGDSLPLANVLARFNPGDPDRLLFLAHWDTRPISDQSADPAEYDTPVPGANDGASGVAVLLALAELLAQQPPPVGMDLLFVDGEDYGPTTADMFIGSSRYVQQPSSSRPRYAVLLDMVGDRDASFPVEGYSSRYAPRVVQRVWGIARELGYGRLFPMTVRPPVHDDHVPLNEAGIPAVDIIDFEYGPDNALWHTPQDVAVNVSAATLEVVGEVVAEIAYRGG